MEKEKIKISHMFLSAGLIYLLGSLGFLVGTLLAYLEKAEVEEFRVLSGVFFWVFAAYGYYYCIDIFKTKLIEKLSYVILALFVLTNIIDLLLMSWSGFNFLIIPIHAGIAYSSYIFYIKYHGLEIKRKLAISDVKIGTCANCNVKLLVDVYDKKKLLQLKQENNWIIGRHDILAKEQWDAVLVSNQTSKCPKCGSPISAV
jgi:hypothetical protein